MTSERAALSTVALSRMEQAELLEYLPEDAVTFRPAALAPGALGEPATAIAVLSLSMVAISGMCAWLAAKGRGFSMSMKATAPGVSGEFTFAVSDRSTPEQVREELESRGIAVPER